MINLTHRWTTRCMVAVTFALVTGGPTVRADVIDILAGPVLPPPEQTVELGAALISAHNPPPDWNVVRVQSGTRLQLSLSEILGQATNITWWHQPQQIGSTGSVPAFVIPEFGVAHNGYYEARFTSSGSGTTTSSVGLEIVATPLARPPPAQSLHACAADHRIPDVHDRIRNRPRRCAHDRRSHVLIRAVGPTLAEYEVEDPLPDPQMTLFNVASGGGIVIGFPAIAYDDGTTPQSRYFDWVRRVSAAVGAFPIKLYEPQTPAPSEDALLIRLSPGAYTVTLQSAAGATGEAMIEIYEVPDEIASALEGAPPPLPDPFDPED